MKYNSSKLFVVVFFSSLITAPLSVKAGVLFSENFDNQPDWHSGMSENATDSNPKGLPDRVQRASTHPSFLNNWYSIRQDPQFAPSVGHADRHEAIEVLSSNADKARGGSGKSYVSWRDSTDQSSYWNSDSQLLKFFPTGYNELYVEFWLRFSPNWTKQDGGGVSKMFRLGSWSEIGNEYSAFSGGEQGPLYLWDWKVDSYGIRNSTALRGGPHGENYGFINPAVDLYELPRASMNFTTDLDGMGVGGTMPKIPDLVNGGFISDDLKQLVQHDQVYGAAGNWTKMAWYVKMNSSIGARDGILRQWINGVQVLNMVQIPWVQANSENKMVKWNFFSIGGNDYFHKYPTTERHEEWYAIDDILVLDTLPELPNPPSNLTIH